VVFGQHKTQGGNVQILADPGSVHDIAAARCRRPPQSSCQLFRGEITEKTLDRSSNRLGFTSRECLSSLRFRLDALIDGDGSG
jgi:hypothetical protein